MARSESGLAELSIVRGALSASEERFRLLVESVKDYAIFLLDPQGRIASWNIGAERIKGYRASEIIGKHFSCFFSEAEVESGKCENELEVAAREGRSEDEGWRIRKDGTRFWAFVVITALRNPQGELVGFAKVTRDLTDQRRAQEQRILLAEQTAARKSAEGIMMLLARLHGLAGSLAAAFTPQQVAQVIVERGAQALNAATGVLCRPKDDQLELIASSGLDESTVSAWRGFPAALRTPICEALRTGTPVWIEDPGEMTRLYPDNAPTAGPSTAAALPLAAGHRVLAIVGFRFDGPRTFSPEVRVLMQAMAAQAAQALDRADAYAREVAARRSVEMLRDISEALSGALSTDDVARVIVERGMASAGADVCTLYVLDDRDGALELVAERGCSPAVVERIRRITRDSGNPAHRAIATREAIWAESPEEYASLFPELAAAGRSDVVPTRALWGFPLIAESRAIGLLGMGFFDARRFGRDDRDFAGALAAQCAQALLRARGHDAKKREDMQRTLLGDVTTVLSESLDYETTLPEVARLVVRHMADWCAVDIAVLGERVPRRLGIAHVDPAKAQLALEIDDRFPPSPNAQKGLPNVLRTGLPEIYSRLAPTHDAPADGCEDVHRAAVARALGTRSAMVVPLVGRSRTLGAITFALTEPGRTYNDDDLRVAEEIARRCAIGVDNAQLYRSEQEARQSAEIANRAKDQFLAMVSHELRTPLNAIMGWTKMMSSPTFDESRRQRAVETVSRNSVAMAQLIEDLLDMSRIISGKMRLDVQHVSLDVVIETALESIKPASHAKGVPIEASLDPAVPGLVGDPTRLQQIVWNLLSNAVKFTPQGGRVRVELRQAASSAEIVVSDTGKGIAPGFLPYVFDAFRQEDGGYTRSRGGLGLGLAITRQLVELHGGRIEAQSEGEGRGATFVVHLPTAGLPSTQLTSAADDARAARAGAFEHPPQLRGLRVLVVDDEEDARQLVKAILDECGCEVSLAASVDEALEAFAAEVPDILVSDVAMPSRDGYDLIRRVRALSAEKGGDVPAAALTAYARAEDRRDLLNAGYSMHIPKPVEPAELVAVVASLTRFMHRERAEEATHPTATGASPEGPSSRRR